MRVLKFKSGSYSKIYIDKTLRNCPFTRVSKKHSNLTTPIRFKYLIIFIYTKKETVT